MQFIEYLSSIYRISLLLMEKINTWKASLKHRKNKEKSGSETYQLQNISLRNMRNKNLDFSTNKVRIREI